MKLFKPVPTKTLVTIYGATLQKVKEGNAETSTQLRLSRLRAELEKLGVPVKKLPGIKLGPQEEEGLQKKFASFYTEEIVHNMTWSEMMMNFVKLSQYGFMDAANLIKDEMMRRGCMKAESTDDTVVDNLCYRDASVMGAM